MLATTRGITADDSQILITRGSQMALYLVARTLLRPKDIIAVEAFGYPPAWTAFRSTGAELAPVKIDEDGMRVDDLDPIAATGRLRAVYVTPHHQYPTTVSLSAPRRQRLLELARRHRFAIIEDDYDHEFHYRGRPVLPLASSEGQSSVIYIGTLSKILAPGLRIGYVLGAGSLISQLVAARVHIDRQGDQIGEAAIAELLEDGEIQRHARRVRRIYQARRDVLLAALGEQIPTLRYDVPDGGLAIWARVPRAVDVAGWARAAAARHVLFHPGQHFAFSGRKQGRVRLGFAAHTPEEIETAVRIAAECI